jgi:membrane protein implicated in regulation of membrane protease activity
VSDQSSPSEQTPARRPTGVVVLVGVLVAIPVVALMWVSSYARETPRLWGVPFFYWYQFLWVFLAAGCTYAAYRLVLMTTPVRRFGQSENRARGER